jgi:hypothetical protein
MTFTDADTWRVSSPLTAFLSREIRRVREILATRDALVSTAAAAGAAHVSHAFVPHGGPALSSAMNTKSDSST